MSSNYTEIKKFIKKIQKIYNVINYVGRILINDLKHNKIYRCPCRVLDKYKLNINKQCSNPVYTLSGICYNCDKNNNYLGFVNIYPNKNIIKKYELYSKRYTMSFNINELNLGLYHKYINTYFKIKIIDYETYSSIILFKKPIYSDHEDYDDELGEQGILIDKYQNMIGTYNSWIDYDYIIDNMFKNEDNQILNPKNNLPLLEYHLTKKSIYHSLTNRIYKKYKFTIHKDRMLLTNDVVDD